MPDARFLQIHSLHGYSAVLLNRDDSGLAKRITYGDAVRTRISSQCLKRHWRVADSEHALQRIDGATASVRSRETVTRRVIEPLEAADHDADAIKAIFGSVPDRRLRRQGRQPLQSAASAAR
jgi:CRISPR system Cascade subunit CasC